MLWRWGQSCVRRESKMIGWYTICPMLKEGIPQQARSYEPTGVAPWEHDQLEAAIARLEEKHALILIRAYRPWQAREVESILIEKHGERSLRSWQRWLHEAVSKLLVAMDEGLATTQKGAMSLKSQEPVV
jgi:hypothetical protein